MTQTRTLAELASIIDADVKGDAEAKVLGVATLADAKTGELSFFHNPKYKSQLQSTQATVVIVSADALSFCPSNALVVKNPYYAYAQVAKLYMFKETRSLGVHSTAVVGEGCQIDESVSIAAHVVIGDHVSIGENTMVGPNTTIGSHSVLGNDCQIDANVTIYHHVAMGSRVVISSGAIIGADGFGHAMENGAWHKVPQLGGVVIADDVEIGANTCIDRGALGDTKIGKGVKLDNLIQIGHNVEVGDHSVMAGCSGIAGSSKLGKYCMMGAGAGLGGHLTIADQTVLAGRSMITRSISEPGVYASGVSFMKLKDWRKSVIRFRQLDKMAKRIQVLETKIKKERVNE